MQAVLLGFHMRTHDAGERAFVGNRQCRVAERCGTLDQFFAVRSAAQKTEVRYAVQLGIAGKVVPLIIRTFRAGTSGRGSKDQERAAEKSTATHAARRAR